MSIYFLLFLASLDYPSSYERIKIIRFLLIKFSGNRDYSVEPPLGARIWVWVPKCIYQKYFWRFLAFHQSELSKTLVLKDQCQALGKNFLKNKETLLFLFSWNFGALGLSDTSNKLLGSIQIGLCFFPQKNHQRVSWQAKKKECVTH